jgi:nicotinate-nucleotide adenylyltransferase
MTSSAARRIGVIGGTFDPIHVGHLEAAEAARRALALDEIRVIPAHDPPHRSVDPRASGFHRFALVALAIAGLPGYRACDMELRRDGPSYTALTLRDLHAQGWRPHQIFFILGADAFADIATWHDYPAILDAAHFVVIARPGTTLDTAQARTPELRARARRPGDGMMPPDAGTSIFLVEAETSAVSSTDLRARLASGASIDGLVPPAVAQHIRAHHLYGATDDRHGQD